MSVYVAKNIEIETNNLTSKAYPVMYIRDKTRNLVQNSQPFSCYLRVINVRDL